MIDVFCSLLGCKKTIEIISRMFEGVDCRCPGCSAIWLPLFVFLLGLWASGLTSAICGHIECPNLGYAMEIHAFLSEQIFSPRTKFPFIHVDTAVRDFLVSQSVQNALREEHGIRVS